MFVFICSFLIGVENAQSITFIQVCNVTRISLITSRQKRTHHKGPANLSVFVSRYFCPIFGSDWSPIRFRNMQILSLIRVQSIEFLSRLNDSYIKRTFSELSTYKRTDIRLTWLRNYVIKLSRFHVNSVAHLRGNILRPRRKCWEDRYKPNEWSEERCGRRRSGRRCRSRTGVLRSEQLGCNPKGFFFQRYKLNQRP